MSRVLSTEEAKVAIQQIQNIVGGGFAEQISQLDTHGRTLSDPNVWDGPLAAQFRDSAWPETRSALERMRSELDELRSKLDQVAQNIFAAGGAA